MAAPAARRSTRGAETCVSRWAAMKGAGRLAALEVGYPGKVGVMETHCARDRASSIPSIGLPMASSGIGQYSDRCWDSNLTRRGEVRTISQPKRSQRNRMTRKKEHVCRDRLVLNR